MNKSRLSLLGSWALIPVLMLAFTTSCTDNPMSNNNSPVETEQTLGKKGGKGNTGETSYTDSGVGTFVGVNDNTDDPTYGSYSYTLWAGKTNDAGTVIVTNNDDELKVTYNTNGTADLKEAHVYVWTSKDDIPDKRPAPGQAPYKAEDINSDSYTFTISENITCGDTFYISTHAALSENNTANDEEGDGSNAGETAYAAGTDATDGFGNQKGAWWGYLTYNVECYYDISGDVYDDLNVDGDNNSEPGIEGTTINLLDELGNVVSTTTTDADGSYTFENQLTGNYTVEVASAPDGYVASENDGGYDFTLGEDTEVNFGFYEESSEVDGDPLIVDGSYDSGSFGIEKDFQGTTGSIKFEDNNGLGEDGAEESVTFTLTYPESVDNIYVATKSGDQAESDTREYVDVTGSGSYTDVGGFTVEWNQRSTNDDGDYVYEFTVTSDSDNSTAALSHISFYFNNYAN